MLGMFGSYILPYFAGTSVTTFAVLVPAQQGKKPLPH
jgi:hypothetical protein